MSNNIIIYLLFAFVALGLAGRRLGRYAPYLMAGVIIIYVIYGYRKG